MLTLQTKARVTEDGTLEIRVATGLPPGEHEAVIAVAPSDRPKPRFQVADFPIHDDPWDDSVSLRREDPYGDDGR